MFPKASFRVTRYREVVNVRVVYQWRRVPVRVGVGSQYSFLHFGTKNTPSSFMNTGAEGGELTQRLGVSSELSFAASAESEKLAGRILTLACPSDWTERASAASCSGMRA